ncbi:fungal-specific transcription factor domain-containing protein [Thamnidium elegans]|nr:fungal-specific transcription factor domain-containing protein [Thamnidium elegans]
MGKQELRYKRLKVGHACFVCRNKKIKCDGLRPCMQCKARGRNCESSILEPLIDTASVTECGTSDNNTDDGSHHSALESDDDCFLFSRAKDDTISPIPNYSESWTSNVINEKAKDFKKTKQLHGLAEYPTFGSFVRWKNEPPLPQKYSHSIEMPSSDIQMHLIDLFFQTRYKIIPMIPKRLFYEQLRTKGPLITPLLLNSMYCLVCAHSNLPDIPSPNIFYNRAKKLLDDFLDSPRVSTVVALCHLALYEPMPTKSRNMPDQHCRSWIYGGMAFRMCLELGLNIDTTQTRGNLSPETIEFCRRVFWSCYCLDKMQSSEWERLWAIPSSLAKTAFPQVLPEDDEEEQWVVTAYIHKIQLAIISEEGLQIRASFAIRNDVISSNFYEQLEQYKLKIFSWRNTLKSAEAWGLDHYQTIEQVVRQSEKSPIVSYVQVIYYFLLTEIFFCLPEAHEKSIEQRLYAARLTQSIDTLCNEPAMVIRYEFLARIAIGAIRVHSRYINDVDPDVSRQSIYFFKKSVKILRNFQKHAMIPECSAVLTHLPVICQKPVPETDIPCPSPSVSSPNLYTCSSPQNFSDVHYDSNASNFQDDVHTVQQLPLRQVQFDQISVDPYRTDTTSSFSYQNINTTPSFSPYQSLAAFGNTIGVDFVDRKQLWDQALQDVLNERPYDVDSAVSTPDEPGFPQTVNSFSNHTDWTSSMTSDFSYPKQTQNSPSLHRLESSPSLCRQHQNIQQHEHEQKYNISPSPQQDVNLLLCNSYSNMNLPFGQPVTILPLPSNYSHMPNSSLDDLHQHDYYSN